MEETSTKYDYADKWITQTYADTFRAINVSMTIHTIDLHFGVFKAIQNKTCNYCRHTAKEKKKQKFGKDRIYRVDAL